MGEIESRFSDWVDVGGGQLEPPERRFYAPHPRPTWEEFMASFQPDCAGGCGRKAKSVRFLENGKKNRYPRDAETTVAVFTCGRHQWGGYEILLSEITADTLADWMRQLRGKTWRGDLALSKA